MDGEKVKACQDWTDAYFFFNAIVYSISFVIAGLNGCMRYSIREMSRLEGCHTETNRLAAATQKMWIVQFFNTAIVLLAINNQIGEDSIIRRLLVRTGLESFLFNGEYDDINSNWYGQVGVSVAITCFLNAVIPVSNFIFYVQKLCYRQCDRGCSCSSKNTKKFVQFEYEQLYTGAVF